MADALPIMTGETRVLRRGRISVSGQVYHVIACTRHRVAHFDSPAAGRTVVHALRREDRRARVRTLTYVVMPDHLHWLFEWRDGAGISACVSAVKSSSARALNAQRGTRGRVWQRGYYDRAIRTEEDLPSVARQIVMNPVRAGVAERVADYPLWDAAWV